MKLAKHLWMRFCEALNHGRKKKYAEPFCMLRGGTGQGVEDWSVNLTGGKEQSCGIDELGDAALRITPVAASSLHPLHWINAQ